MQAGLRVALPRHAEVDLVLVDGRSVDFDHLLRGGERVAMYPVFERLDISPVPLQVFLLHRDFSRCEGCGRVYWPGSQRARLDVVIERGRAAAQR